MLKIREDVDLKELEKYGFVILYNAYTGEPDKLYQRWGLSILRLCRYAFY